MKMTKLKILWLLPLILMLMVASVYGQTKRGNGKLFGSLMDESGKAVFEGKIILKKIMRIDGDYKKDSDQSIDEKNIKYGIPFETLSDKDGKWMFKGLTKGTYKLTASKQGFPGVVQVLKLYSQKRNPPLNLVLKKGKTVEKPNEAMVKLVKKGNKLFKAKNYKDAIPLFKQFLSDYPENFKVGVNLGNCYMELKAYQEAIDAFGQVISGFEKNKDSAALNADKTLIASVYANIGDAYTAMQKLDKAADAYIKSMAMTPEKNEAVVFRVAEIMFNSGKTDEAIKYFKMAVDLNPKKAENQSKLGYAYLNKGDMKNAVIHFEKFLELAPKDPQAATLKSLVSELKKQQ